MLRKLDFDTIYSAFLYESPFKYYISIRGGWVGGLRPGLIRLFRGGGPEFGKTFLSNTCMLPKILTPRPFLYPYGSREGFPSTSSIN